MQAAYNEEHGITPQSIVKQIDDVLSSVYERDYLTPPTSRATPGSAFRTQAELDAHIAGARSDEMKAAAANLDFEKAARAARRDSSAARSASSASRPRRRSR